MQLDQFLHECESDSRSLMLTRLRSVNLVEAVEDFVKLIGRYAEACVAHSDLHTVNH